MHYLCAVIILFIAQLCKPAFFCLFFKKLVFDLSVFFFYLFCFEFFGVLVTYKKNLLQLLSRQKTLNKV